MNLEINVNDGTVYIRSQDPAFAMSLYRQDGEDYVGFTGDNSKRGMCVEIADVILRNTQNGYK